MVWRDACLDNPAGKPVWYYGDCHRRSRGTSASGFIMGAVDTAIASPHPANVAGVVLPTMSICKRSVSGERVWPVSAALAHRVPYA